MEVLIFNLIFGIICAVVASNKGRSAVGWFALGFFFPIIAIIVLCCIANLKDEELRRRDDYERTHRIREQLRQEQIKNEAFQRHAGARMDVHDRALGMNTRNAEAVADGGGGMISAATTSAPPPIVAEDLWFYAMGHEQRGPVDGYEMREMIAKGSLARTTLVWRQGMREWRRVQDLPELGMTARPGGTFAVDGLIEGPMPEEPGARKNLEDWNTLLRKTGIRMSLEVDGSRFSLLPDPTPVPRTTVGPAPSRTLRDCLQQLLDAFPPAHRAAVFSTLRSSEVDGGVEVQTAYLVGRDGRIEVKDRTVEAAAGIARTGAPRWTRALLIGTVLLAALFVSSLFVDYRVVVRDLWSSVAPLSLPDSTVDPGAFAPWLSARVKTVDGRSRAIGIEVSRTSAFPKSAAEIEAALAAPGLSLDARLALNALATGYVRCEISDETGAFLDVAMLRVRDLASADSIVRMIVVPPGVRPRRLVLAP